MVFEKIIFQNRHLKFPFWLLAPFPKQCLWCRPLLFPRLWKEKVEQPSCLAKSQTCSNWYDCRGFILRASVWMKIILVLRVDNATCGFTRFHVEENWAQKYICGEKWQISGLIILVLIARVGNATWGTSAMAAPWLPRADVPESSDKTDRCLGAPVSGNISTFVIINSIGVNMKGSWQHRFVSGTAPETSIPNRAALVSELVEGGRGWRWQIQEKRRKDTGLWQSSLSSLSSFDGNEAFLRGNNMKDKIIFKHYQ